MASTTSRWAGIRCLRLPSKGCRRFLSLRISGVDHVVGVVNPWFVLCATTVPRGFGCGAGLPVPFQGTTGFAMCTPRSLNACGVFRHPGAKIRSTFGANRVNSRVFLGSAWRCVVGAQDESGRVGRRPGSRRASRAPRPSPPLRVGVLRGGWRCSFCFAAGWKPTPHQCKCAGEDARTTPIQM